jgi:hypothetical protein
MPIRWNPQPIRVALDQVEALLQEVSQMLEDIIQLVDQAAATPDLPTYMSESLKNIPRHAQEFRKSIEQDIRLARERIPDSPVVRTKTQSGPSLF